MQRGTTRLCLLHICCHCRLRSCLKAISTPLFQRCGLFLEWRRSSKAHKHQPPAQVIKNSSLLSDRHRCSRTRGGISSAIAPRNRRPTRYRTTLTANWTSWFSVDPGCRGGESVARVRHPSHFSRCITLTLPGRSDHQDPEGPRSVENRRVGSSASPSRGGILLGKAVGCSGSGSRRDGCLFFGSSVFRLWPDGRTVLAAAAWRT